MIFKNYVMGLIYDDIGRELYLSDWYNNQDCSIRTLELEFARPTAIAMKELNDKNLYKNI